ncbi:Tetraspanin-11 [Eufriesea mexicana]|nr:Tetraspanin-11 [Eufriesea mexicana]
MIAIGIIEIVGGTRVASRDTNLRSVPLITPKWRCSVKGKREGSAKRWNPNYVFVVMLVFVLEAGVGALARLYEEQVGPELTMNLNRTFLEYYSMRSRETSAINQMQMEFKCCGALRFEDWLHSEWHKHEEVVNDGSLVPDSCCKTPTYLCGRRDHPSNIHYTVPIDFQSMPILHPRFETARASNSDPFGIPIEAFLAASEIQAFKDISLSRLSFHLFLDNSSRGQRKWLNGGKLDDKSIFSHRRLHLQVSRDDQGASDHPRCSGPGTIGARVVRHRARLVPLHKAQARLRRLRIASSPREQQQRPFLVQIHAERRWSRLIVGLEGKEEERPWRRGNPSSDVRHSGFPPFLTLNFL